MTGILETGIREPGKPGKLNTGILDTEGLEMGTLDVGMILLKVLKSICWTVNPPSNCY